MAKDPSEIYSKTDFTQQIAINRPNNNGVKEDFLIFGSKNKIALGRDGTYYKYHPRSQKKPFSKIPTKHYQAIEDYISSIGYENIGNNYYDFVSEAIKNRESRSGDPRNRARAEANKKAMEEQTVRSDAHYWEEDPYEHYNRQYDRLKVDENGKTYSEDAQGNKNYNAESELKEKRAKGANTNYNNSIRAQEDALGNKKIIEAQVSNGNMTVGERRALGKTIFEDEIGKEVATGMGAKNGEDTINWTKEQFDNFHTEYTNVRHNMAVDKFAESAEGKAKQKLAKEAGVELEAVSSRAAQKAGEKVNKAMFGKAGAAAKYAIGGVLMYGIYSAFNNKGEQSNAQLYGQQPRY